MEIERTYRTKYYRPVRNLRFGQSQADKSVVDLTNFIAKKIKFCPQATARDALKRGLMEIAREAQVDLSGVILTADSNEAKEHGGPSYPPENKSQDKKVG